MESGLECTCMNNDDFTVLVTEDGRLQLSEHMHSQAVTFKMTEQAEQWVCIKLFDKFEHSSAETIGMIQKAAAMGSWWLAASLGQHACSCITSPAEFVGETSNHPGDSAPLQPRFGTLDFWLFPKLKSPLTGKRFQTIDEIQENMMGQLMAAGRTAWGPKVCTLKGTEVSLSCVQCYLVSSSINISIFILHG